ncbi:MAG: glucose-6-phosphate isomerase [Oscillospiraceae bacterium]|jgi:glucose-6-phosphate isomerase|nr:glucose-6-phosphate isomerase [Oscillospiraceae bacterium]
MIRLDLSGISGFLEKLDLGAAEDAARRIPAHEMSGWAVLPAAYSVATGAKLRGAGSKIAESSDALVVLGAGGSSLGARALIEAIPGRGGVREVYFAGDNLSGVHMARLTETLRDRDFSVIAASKSGTTTEPAVALRVFLKLLRERYGDLRDRLYIVAGEHESPMRSFAETCGCALFGIPESVGGRYSVLTAAGLLTAAARGIDIDEIVAGARSEAESGAGEAIRYAAARQGLYAAGYRTEIFASFEPDAKALGEWWRQLFGESEGKGGGGIFPATVGFTGDLHSMGQYIQEGRRDIFETILEFGARGGDAVIPANAEFDDGFAFLDGRGFNDVNDVAARAVRAAHIDGGVPVLGLEAGSFDERGLGALMYFFETACAVSAFLAGVDPFDQPGVEKYKGIMRGELRGTD